MTILLIFAIAAGVVLGTTIFRKGFRKWVTNMASEPESHSLFARIFAIAFVCALPIFVFSVSNQVAASIEKEAIDKYETYRTFMERFDNLRILKPQVYRVQRSELKTYSWLDGSFVMAVVSGNELTRLSIVVPSEDWKASVGTSIEIEVIDREVREWGLAREIHARRQIITPD